jgi:hypothetical protein
MRDSARNARTSEPLSRPVFLGSLLSSLDATGDLPPAFQDLRLRFDQAKAHFESSDMSPERYANLLAAMRCYDSDGRTWTIGATSGLWYRLVEDTWVQSPPPYQSATAISSAAQLYYQAGTQANAEAGGQAPTPSSPTPSSPTPSSPTPSSPTPSAPEPLSSGREELLFGLPVQLFADEAVDPGPVPHGALPSFDPGSYSLDPQPRRVEPDPDAAPRPEHGS